MGDGRLAGTGLLDEVAGAHGLRGEQRHDPGPQRVGEQLGGDVGRRRAQHARRPPSRNCRTTETSCRSAGRDGRTASKMYPKPRTVRM